MKEYLKKNKFLFILPLGLLPFVFLIFYVLGGGKFVEKDGHKHADKPSTSGANYIIPEAEKSIEIFDKLEAYQRQGIEMENQRPVVDSTDVSISDSINNVREMPVLLAEQNHLFPEQLLKHIKQKEKQVQSELNEEAASNSQPRVKQKKSYQSYQPETPEKPSQFKEQTTIQATGIEELEKVFDENIALSRKNDSLEFYLNQAQSQVQLKEAKRSKGFALEKQQVSGFQKNEMKSHLISAEIYETATILDGNRIKLRLLENTQVNGKPISRNTFMYGVCKIKNERLHISIIQLATKEDFIPVKLSIYDLDGMEGLYVPDKVARKVYKEVGASTNTSSLIGATNDPLTYAGIRAADRTAQTLLKRVRLKKITIKKNTLVYLINQN